MKRHLIVVAVAALGLGLSPVSAVEEAEKYPIWWSPSLELESLDKIDERLGRSFLPGQEEYSGIYVYKDGDRASERAEIDSCTCLDRLSNEGFYTLLNIDSQILMGFGTVCAAIELLGEAKAAETSYVQDFVMTADALDYLPAMIDIAPGCDWMCRQYRANERRIPLSRFEQHFNVKVKVLSETKIEGRYEGSFFDVEIVARADFSGDGLEDLLVIAGADATEGTWGMTTYFLLSRNTADGVFWVVDAKDYLCTDYECQAHYDEPAVLR